MLTLILLGAVLLALIAVLLFPWVAGSRLAGYCAQEGRYRYGRARISELYPRLQTGDILLFAARASLIPILTQSQFTHAALVVRRPGPRCGPQCRGGRAARDCIDCDVLVAELSGGIGDGKLADGFSLPAGAVLSPLLPRLKCYPGTAYLMRLAPGAGAPGAPEGEGAAEPGAGPAAAIEAAVAARLGRPFAHPASILLAALLRRPTFHCYGLVSQLIDAALRREDAPPLSSASVLGVVPAVEALQGAPLLDAGGARYSYRPLVEIVYDIDCEGP